MRYRQMKAVLAVLERADGRYLVHCILAEPPAGDWWVAVRDHTRGTDHQIDDYRRFVATFPDLDRPALAVLAPSFPEARLLWGDVVRRIGRDTGGVLAVYTGGNGWGGQDHMAEQPAQQTPIWQPSGKVFLVGTMIDGMLENAQEQYRTLLEARPKPHVLDDGIVGRLVAVYTAQRDDLWLWDEQLRRWSGESLNGLRRREVERLHGQMAALRTVVDDILALTGELATGTIEKVLAKDDMELGLEFLLGLARDGERDR